MNNQLVAARVESIWSDYCDERTVENREVAFSDNGNDSFDQVEFVMDLEEEFRIRISDTEEELLGKMTIDDLICFVTQKLL